MRENIGRPVLEWADLLPRQAWGPGLYKVEKGDALRLHVFHALF